MEQITAKIAPFLKSKYAIVVIGGTVAVLLFNRLTTPKQENKVINYQQADPYDKDILKLSMETSLKKDALAYTFKSHELDLEYGYKTNLDNNSTKIRLGEIDSNTKIFESNKKYDSANYLALLENDAKKHIADRQAEAEKEKAWASVKQAKESRSKGFGCCGIKLNW